MNLLEGVSTISLTPVHSFYIHKVKCMSVYLGEKMHLVYSPESLIVFENEGF